ncbi:hypothetical protein CRUP_000247 [Coryphaenoides rupestris]|nr:hypothetical protein CRUP_000247 [Coryphaenoides rupestris]
MWKRAGIRTRLPLLACLLLALWTEVSQSTGYLELQLISVENLNGERADGECCVASRGPPPDPPGCGPDQCDTYFEICLKEYQMEVNPKGPCTYGYKSTKVLGGNTIDFRSAQNANKFDDAGRIVIPFQFAWPFKRCLINGGGLLVLMTTITTATPSGVPPLR